jgi:DNA-directed RNA polymerase subunit RPC12/RpoP
MINGPAIYICSECVVLCIGIIGHEMADDLGREVLCDAARQWIGGEMADVSKTMIMLAKQIDALAKSLTPCPECASQILETPPAIAEQSEAVTAEPEGP